jgi:hypothetical protein
MEASLVYTPCSIASDISGKCIADADFSLYDTWNTLQIEFIICSSVASEPILASWSDKYIQIHWACWQQRFYHLLLAWMDFPNSSFYIKYSLSLYHTKYFFYFSIWTKIIHHFKVKFQNMYLLNSQTMQIMTEWHKFDYSQGFPMIT